MWYVVAVFGVALFVAFPIFVGTAIHQLMSLGNEDDRERPDMGYMTDQFRREWQRK